MFSAATSASRSAYVGVQNSAVASRRPQQLDPREAAQPAARYHQRPARHDRIERAPEPDERPERKRQQHPVARRQLGRVEHELPAVDPPLPIVGRVEHHQRPAVRARRFMTARVRLDRKRPIRRKRLATLRLQLVLRRERQLRQARSRLASCRGQPASLRLIELVRRQHRRQLPIELLQLQPLERTPIQRFEVAALIERKHVMIAWHSSARSHVRHAVTVYSPKQISDDSVR